MRPSAACGRDPGKLFATLRSAQSDTSSLSQAAELISGLWLGVSGFFRGATTETRRRMKAW